MSSDVKKPPVSWGQIGGLFILLLGGYILMSIIPGLFIIIIIFSILAIMAVAYQKMKVP